MATLTHRRRFWPVIVIVVLLASWLLIRSALQAQRWQNAKLVNVSHLQPGSVQQMEGLWIARQPNGDFYVFLDIDPHLGHPTAWIPSQDLFISPAHQETYSIDGRCLAGPCGVGSLYRVAAREEGAYLRVLPDEIISGGIAGERPWLTVIKKLLGITKRPQDRPQLRP